ncbi:phosphoserine phosphatase SerB [Prosthecomicrobium sp. N25]|uniref:phosphoserine phosphatase SerB n=1 Tax=Prosthecomicrobium sp. N25 TaxID=3129254 RepID=UPI00307780AE
MTHVATLISTEAQRAVTPDAVAAVRAALAGAAPGEPVVLDPEVAVDLPLAPAPEADPRALAEAARAALADRPVDVVVQPLAHRRKRLFLADMDSTMIGQECIDELAAEVGLKDRIAAITERAMRGEIAFEPALRERVGLLAGLDAAVIDRLIAERITLTPGGRTLVMTMRAAGAYTALVSGGFTVFTGPVAAMIGFDENRANILLAEGGRLLGRVEEPILGADAKLATLRELAAARAIPPAETLAVGDGANDLPMLEAAGLGVAYRAKPKVAARAAARIEHADLTALLYLQGYRREDFAGP